MQEPPVQPFDDPALKVALGRALGRPCAPAALRQRILTAVREESGKSTGVEVEHKPIRMFRQSPLYKLAMAAVVLICVGIAAVMVYVNTRPPTYDVAYDFPKKLYADMLATHDARAKSTTGDTVTILAAATDLSKQLNQPVFVADLTKDGWAFAGGAVRNVGKYSAAQLFFTKGTAKISVFSLPRETVPKAPEGSHYDTTWNQGAIAGFMGKGGLFCIVRTGDTPPTSADVDEVKRLLAEHEGEIRRS
jgi:hypothetical protein